MVFAVQWRDQEGIQPKGSNGISGSRRKERQLRRTDRIYIGTGNAT